MKSTTINSFSFQRVLQLCKRYVAIKRSMILIGFAVVITLIGAVTIWIFNFFPEGQRSLDGLFILAFSLFHYAGYAFSSTIFNELNEKGFAPQFFTLPAKTSEKILSACLISYVCYTIVGILFLYIFALIIGMDISSTFTMKNFSDLMIYTMLQSIFIFGAVFFKANNFLSTLVSIFVFMITFTLVYMGLRFYVPGFETWLSGSLSVLTSSLFANVASGLIYTLMVSGIFIWFTFIRLKNRQIA